MKKIFSNSTELPQPQYQPPDFRIWLIPSPHTLTFATNELTLVRKPRSVRFVHQTTMYENAMSNCVLFRLQFGALRYLAAIWSVMCVCVFRLYHRRAFNARFYPISNPIKRIFPMIMPNALWSLPIPLEILCS